MDSESVLGVVRFDGLAGLYGGRGQTDSGPPE